MKKYINIGNKKVGVGRPAFIIAEAGVNHNGSLKLAKKMVEAAKLAGVDAIKFQTFKTEELITTSAPKANYQKSAVGTESQFEMLKKLELTHSEFEELFNFCKKKGILFLSTPFDFQSAEFLYNLGVAAFKVASGDLENLPFLLQIANYGRPLILSTGMSVLREVKEAVRVVYSTGNKKLILLHCISNYPAKYEDVNLKAMDTLRREFNVPVGYSDHTQGIEVALAASSLGACVIEKHFTLDRSLLGPDHKSSLEPDVLKGMVVSIRNIEKAMGNGMKVAQKSEIEIKKIARKSIVTACNIPKGVKIIEEMLAIKRPGTGIPPKYLNLVIGKRVKRNISKERPITWDLVERK